MKKHGKPNSVSINEENRKSVIINKKTDNNCKETLRIVKFKKEKRRIMSCSRTHLWHRNTPGNEDSMHILDRLNGHFVDDDDDDDNDDDVKVDGGLE
jgi:hypothetical protein